MLPAVAGAEKVLLAPTVVKFDAKGKALTELATIQKRELVVDILPWAKWVQLETKTSDEKLAKLMLETVIVQLHRTFMADPPNLSMVGKGKDIAMRAKGRFPRTQVVIPMFPGSHAPWLWRANRGECDLAMASIARLIGLGGL